MTLVLDASAAIELLLDTSLGRRVALHLPDNALIAPELLDVEVCSALARLERAQTLQSGEADALVEALAALPVDRLPHAVLMQHAWSLRGHVRVADAFYVSCARLTGSPLLTCDARLSRAELPGLSITLIQ